MDLLPNEQHFDLDKSRQNDKKVSFFLKKSINFPYVIQNREFKFRVIRQTLNARQGKNSRYQAIKSK
jgi:hypothetical protein